MKSQDRYQRGLKKHREIHGKDAVRGIEDVAAIEPDFARYMVEFGFGDIFSRPALDLKSREIIVVSALIALGNATPQLKIHINAALNVGWTRQEIREVIIQMALYAGFPAALNALFAARDVFKERDQSGKT